MGGRRGRARVLVAVGAVLATALVPAGATAMPPTGLAYYTDVARAQATSAAAVRVPPGSSAYVGRFTLAPGTGIGWRSLPGVAILSVMKGTLRVVRPNCSLAKANTGLAAVLPAGDYLFGNRSTTNVEFVGVFVNLRKGQAPPLLAPGPPRAPAVCKIAPQWDDPSGANLKAVDVAKGKFADRVVQVGGSRVRTSSGGLLQLKQGRDILVTTFTAAPGAGTGWIRHYPALTFVNRGALTYYEERDETCVQRGQFRRGDAFGRGDGEKILAANEGAEDLVMTFVFINVPHRGGWLPVGNHLEAMDSTPLPPLECTKL